MQKDLEKLASEMQKLLQKDRKNWLHALRHCHESSLSRIYHPTHNKTPEDFQRAKRVLIWSLSATLTGTDKDTLVKKGVDAFMAVSEQEREVFYKTVQKETPCQIATQPPNGISMAIKTRTRE